VAIFLNYMMMSVLNRRSCTVARKTEITVLFAKVCNVDKRLSVPRRSSGWPAVGLVGTRWYSLALLVFAETDDQVDAFLDLVVAIDDQVLDVIGCLRRTLR
jgi:hypothetical protein